MLEFDSGPARRRPQLFQERFGTPDARWSPPVASPPIRRSAPRSRRRRQGADHAHHPAAGLCTDNGAMIAWAGAERLAAGMTDTLETPPRARWLLDAKAQAPAGFANTRAGF